MLIKLIKNPITVLSLIFLSVFLFYQCGKKDPVEGESLPIQSINYIRISPDLSNRLNRHLYKLNLEDTIIFNNLSDFIYSKLIFGENLNIDIFDIYKIDFINPKQFADLGNAGLSELKLEIDLSKFCKDNLSRNKYLGLKGSPSDFRSDLLDFSKTFKFVEDNFRNSGYTSDVYSYVKNIKSQDSIDGCSFANINTQIRNSVVLMTDGYIETNIDSSLRNSEDLSVYKIYAFRHDYELNGKGKSVYEHLKASNFRITPVKNKDLSKIHFLVSQFFDRGDTKGGNGQVVPDFDIIKAFWQLWLEESGVPSNQITILKHDQLTSSNDIQREFSKFLNIN